MLHASSVVIILLAVSMANSIAVVLAVRSSKSERAASETNQSTLRIALVGFVGSNTGKQPDAISQKPVEALESFLKRDSRVSLIEPSLIMPALAGVGYSRSINMSKDEARRIGAAIGCDFFITGKSETVRRSDDKGESHEESYIGLMIVDGRTGGLALFDFVVEKASTQAGAMNQLAKSIESRSRGYVDNLIEYRARRLEIKQADASSGERVEEMPAEGSPQAAGFTAPEFLNRVKPEYAAEAERADISATVEASAVFRANGEVGEIEIIRWAGFKLDESAERAIRQLKFKPATRDGKPASVRALVQYNFRRKSESN